MACFREESIDRVKHIVLDHVGSNVRAFLFGSSARGDERRDSDIDVGLWGPQPVDAWTLSQIRTTIEESIVPFHVDIVDFYTKSDTFRETALKDSVAWNS